MPLGSFFRRKRSNLLELLTQQIEKTVEGLRALGDFLESGNQQSAAEVERLEREADELRHMLIDDLNRSFVTPVDREDLFALSRAIDDILDYGYTTVVEMTTLQVKSTPYLISMVATLVEATEEIHLGIVQLLKRPQIVLDHASKAKALENQAEGIYREALADLFKDAHSIDEVLNILKTREIYRHLSNAADRGDLAANVMSDIVVKMT